MPHLGGVLTQIPVVDEMSKRSASHKSEELSMGTERSGPDDVPMYQALHPVGATGSSDTGARSALSSHDSDDRECRMRATYGTPERSMNRDGQTDDLSYTMLSGAGRTSGDLYAVHALLANGSIVENVVCALCAWVGGGGGTACYHRE
jgi:hypothetical protein